MGNCLGHRPESPGPQTNTAENNQLGRADRTSNSRLLQSEGNSTSLGHSRFFGPSSSNTFTSDTSTSVLGSEYSQTSQVRGQEEEFPDGQILDAPDLRVFNLAELKTATRNFRANTVLGKGGFGTVYKGCLREETGSSKVGELVVAIKRMNSDSKQGIEEWLSEVKFLGRLSHPNLVKLFGFAREDGELILVYEFMPRGSLANHLFGRGANIRPLSWGTRLKVMIGAARGLCFLHSLEKKIIYRDFKPSNILLDRSYNAKLADFGLAKLGPSGDRSHVTTKVVGTHGYAAPEYIATGHLSVKSDVYGFGVVLVEILTGKSIRDIRQQQSGQQSLVDWLKSNLLRSGKMRGTMDPGLEGKYPPTLALQVAKLALKCIRFDNKLRPSMTEVVETLEQIEAANIEKSSDNRRHATRSRAAQLHGRPDGG